MAVSKTIPPKGQKLRLYAAREPIFPRRVRGTFRTLKWWIMGVTLSIYYLTPWIRFDRGPEMPNQAVLIDLAHRRFFMFWIEIWPHEFYFVAGLLIMAGVGLFLLTSALGRVWCGYACPQTVWTDLFILVERWIDGDRNARVRLWNKPWTLDKLMRRIVKWSVWLLIGLLTGGAWIFYFADAPGLALSLLDGTASPLAWTSIALLTTTTVVLGGFMREQVCTYMCPWPRIQAAMTDEETLMVGYRFWRGEPRGKHSKREQTTGDCVDCSACVNVCPVGIDIRNGQQLECITCALCIDACDEVMDRLGRPRGLIDYMTVTDQEAEQNGAAARPALRHIFRPRTIVYSLLWALIGLGLVYGLFIRSDLEFSVAPVRNPVFVRLSDGDVRNMYTFRLRNKTSSSVDVRLGVDNPEMRLRTSSDADTIVTIGVDSTSRHRVFIDVSPDSKAARTARTPIHFWIENTAGGKRHYVRSIFNGDAP